MVRTRLKGSTVAGAALLFVLPAIFAQTVNPYKATVMHDLTGRLDGSTTSSRPYFRRGLRPR